MRVNNRVPVVLGHSLEKPVAAAASASDEQIQTSEITHRSRDCRFSIGSLGYVPHMRDRPPTQATDFSSYFFQALSVAAHEHHSSPLGRQASSRGGTNTATAPRDKSRLSGESQLAR